MNIAISTNLAGVGLETDARLLEEFLLRHGHCVTLVQYDQPLPVERFDLLIALEVMTEELAVLSSRCWVIANPEWTKPEYCKPIQRHCERVIAKTRDAERALREKFTGVVYTGFLTRDKMDATVPRERKFLHIGGNSGLRNTAAVISAWREYRYWLEDGFNAELTVVTNSTTVTCEPTPGVTFIKRATDEEITRLQNSHLYHLYPSAYEGWGHALHEAQSVGAIVLTTDAAPMNEFGCPFTIPSIANKRRNLGMIHEVGASALREQVIEMLESEDLEALSLQSRADFEASNAAFGEAFLRLLEPGADVELPKPVVAIWGNLDAQYSTENDWVDSFRTLGYRVVTFQENQIRTEDILEACLDNKVRLLCYVHTHSWSSPGRMSPEKLITELRAKGIKTVSPHLDLYFGLNIGDGRDDNVGKHAFFKTDLVMTADGSSQEKFAERGVKHVWMPPGVNAHWCEPGTPREDLMVDLGFIGARGYHKEYGWRGEMLDTLKEVYGNRFRVFTGYRGQDLNDLLASVKVLIGDCCFSGKPKYWSDRCPEHAGRGGFILHPRVEGLCIPTATFDPQNMDDLLEKIDYYLEHDVERDLIRRAAHEHVKAHDTYVHRAKQILRAVGL